MKNGGTPPRLWPGSGDGTILGALLAAALLLRLTFLTIPRVLTGDELHYAESLFEFMRGRFLAGVSDYWSFLYPLAALPFGLVSGDAEVGLRLLSVLAGTATVIPVFLLARRMWGGRAALFAGGLVALHPNLIAISTGVMTEPLFSFLLMLSLFLFLRLLQRESYAGAAAVGAVLGLAFLTRQEAQFILLLLLLVLLVSGGEEGARRPWRVRLRQAAAVLGLFLVVIAPYLVLLHAKTGRWTTGSKAGVNLSSPVIWQNGLEQEKYLYSLNAEGTERSLDAAAAENPLRIAWRQRRAIASRYYDNLTAGLGLVPTLVSTPLLLPLIPLGLFGRRWRRDCRWTEFTLLAFGIFPFALYSAMSIGHRFLYPFLPAYLAWGGAGCERFMEWTGENLTPRRTVARLVPVILALSLLPYTAHKYRETRQSQPLEWKEIGRWIGEHEGRGRSILARPGCSIGYYAGNPRASYIPWTDVSGLMRFARYHGFDLLVLDEDHIRALRPGLVGLLQNPPPEDLDEIRRFPGRNGGQVVIFRIKPAS